MMSSAGISNLSNAASDVGYVAKENRPVPSMESVIFISFLSKVLSLTAAQCSLSLWRRKLAVPWPGDVRSVTRTICLRPFPFRNLVATCRLGRRSHATWCSEKRSRTCLLRSTSFLQRWVGYFGLLWADSTTSSLQPRVMCRLSHTDVSGVPLQGPLFLNEGGPLQSDTAVTRVEALYSRCRFVEHSLPAQSTMRTGRGHNEAPRSIRVRRFGRRDYVTIWIGNP